MLQSGDKQLEDIKRLLMLLLMKLDTKSEEIALALQVHPGAVRKMMPGGKVKRIVKKVEA
jgi:predicted transcriptional regulator